METYSFGNTSYHITIYISSWPTNNFWIETNFEKSVHVLVVRILAVDDDVGLALLLLLLLVELRDVQRLVDVLQRKRQLRQNYHQILVPKNVNLNKGSQK